MFATKVIFVLGLTLTIVAAGIPGGVTELEGEGFNTAKKSLETSLTLLSAGDGPSYKLGKVISVTSQVVSGNLYKYKVELIDSENVTKTCHVEKWEQPWLENGIQVTFDCGGEKVVKKHKV